MNTLWRATRRHLRLLGVAALAAVMLAACAKTSDVARVEDTNEVQDQRLKALEDSVGQALAEQKRTLDELERTTQALRGRMANLTERTERIAGEQQALSESFERDTAERRKLTRTVTEQVERIERFQVEVQSEQDKLRLQLADLEQLLQSPIADLPARSAADKDFRRAFYALVNGELDLAADRFAAFRQAHPRDERAVEALFRQGQAFFLLRKYDHALIPFFELVDEHGGHALANRSRWFLARALEETGDLKLAREFYAQLINNETPYAKDATRRVAFINKLFPQK